MNFKNMPEFEWAWGHPVSVAIMVVIDIRLYFQFKRPSGFDADSDAGSHPALTRALIRSCCALRRA
jgi:hypothetical protein